MGEDRRFLHEVRAYNNSGKLIRQRYFETAGEAFTEYQDIIESAKTLPESYGVYVVRYNDGQVMNEYATFGGNGSHVSEERC